MREYIAEWTGSWPCLCIGEWTLKLIENEKETDLTHLIPEDLRAQDMGTYGEYRSWHFGPDWDEIWETYEDGMQEEDWCNENAEWLTKIGPKEDWPEIYFAFNVADFRHGSCGGCI